MGGDHENQCLRNSHSVASKSTRRRQGPNNIRPMKEKIVTYGLALVYLALAAIVILGPLAAMLLIIAALCKYIFS
jgi:hypothetical protein